MQICLYFRVRVLELGLPGKGNEIEREVALPVEIANGRRGLNPKNPFVVHTFFSFFFFYYVLFYLTL